MKKKPTLDGKDGGVLGFHGEGYKIYDFDEEDQKEPLKLREELTT
jgi:hypothetical protein